MSIERQNKLYVYQLQPDGGLGREPLFVKDTLADPGNEKPAQGAGPIHVHPNGRFVYVTNRNQGEIDVDGKKVFNGGENNVAVFAIDAADRRAEADPDHRGPRHPPAHLRHRSERAAVGGDEHPADAVARRQDADRRASWSIASATTAGSNSCANTTSTPRKGQQFWSGMVTLG